MFSTPLIDSSSGIATVSAITFGLAPGYCARTTIDGGTTCGYSAIGSMPMAIAPARKISSERTPAKMGRSMKNLERFIVLSWKTAKPGTDPNFGLELGSVPRLHLALELGSVPSHLRFLGRHEHSGAHALQAVHDDPLAGLERSEERRVG